MERNIGEIFEFGGDWYQCVGGTCRNCSFYYDTVCKNIITIGNTTIGNCHCSLRTDHKSVIFKKLEKVGEPFIGKVHIQLQRYKIYAEPIVDPTENVGYVNEGNTIAIEIKEDMEEKKLNLKPFDLEVAKAGKPVYTRDGRKVRIICFDAKRKDEKNIIALVPSKDYPGFEDLIAYPNNGNYHGGHENDGDLMMLPEKKEGYINIYCSDKTLRRTEYSIFDNKEEAIKAKTNKNYITTIKIEWEE